MNFAEEMRKKAEAVVEEAERVRDIQIINESFEKIDAKIRELAGEGQFRIRVAVLRENAIFYDEHDIMVGDLMNAKKAMTIITTHYSNEGFSVYEDDDVLIIGWKE